MYIITNITDHLVRIAAILAIMPVSVSSADRGIPVIFSVTTEQCTTGTTNGVLMMKRQLKCNSAPNL
jgi:hypothetical protein